MSKKLDKIEKVNDSFTVYRYDNGFMLEVGGRNSNEEWKTCKILCTSEEELIGLIKEAITLPLEN